MSMQICVLADSRLGSSAEWQRHIDAEGFPLRLFDGTSGNADGGNLSAQLRDAGTSIEYGSNNLRDLKDTYQGIDFGHDWKYVIGFTWSSDADEEIAAWMAATAYARATGGVVFDEQAAKLLTPDEALANTREIERRRPELEAVFRNIAERRIAESPESEAVLRAFVQQHSGKARP
jgi:hypothetical protein